MGIDWHSWISLIIRWTHVIVGIAWIGSSFYFVWLDNNLEALDEKDDADGELWSVHGGGFYHNRKFKVAPDSLKSHLHWFKYEAYFTWITGFLLFAIIYYYGAKIYLIDSHKADLTSQGAIAISLGIMFGSWFIYDLLCKSPLRHTPKIFGGILFLFLTVIAYLTDQIFSDRASYIQIGAVIGTLMAGNVFRVIIPNQKIVVADLLANQPVDPALGQAAKLRSMHNNYMTLPVLFIMISNHYPQTYAQPVSWFTLAMISLAGICVRHYFNIRHKKVTKDPFLFAAGFFMFVAILVPASLSFNIDRDKRQARLINPELPSTSEFMTSDVALAITKHCTSCHSPNPPHELYQIAPNGILLDTEADIKKHKKAIYEQVILYEVMPMGDEFEITDAEKAAIAKWGEEPSND